MVWVGAGGGGGGGGCGLVGLGWGGVGWGVVVKVGWLGVCCNKGVVWFGEVEREERKKREWKREEMREKMGRTKPHGCHISI